MKKYEEKVCRHALSRIFGFHPVKALTLIDRFGSAGELFSIGGKTLVETAGGGYKEICRINDSEYETAEKELRAIELSGARFLCENEADFPALLKECEDRPVGLYIRSESSDGEIFNKDATFISVVGTRDISLYGSEWCARIVETLALTADSPTIVSGLAIGTDITAHRKALASGCPTIAVLPTGIDAVYPYRHTNDAEKIAKSPRSAIITDYPPGTAPLPFNFLRRNRIIAGLSKATILIESKIQGGGMSTARLAFSYNRDVYAVPGRIEDINSQGCNALVGQRIAEPVVCETSLLQSLGLSLNGERKSRGEDLSDNKALMQKVTKIMQGDDALAAAAILSAITKERGIDIEQIAIVCGLEYKKAAGIVSMLEVNGLIYVDLMQRCAINYK